MQGQGEFHQLWDSVKEALFLSEKEEATTRENLAGPEYVGFREGGREKDE